MSGADGRQYHYEFSRTVGTPALSQLRAWLRDRLTNEAPNAVWDAELAVTELVSNAYEHARGAITVQLHLIAERAVLRVEVEDGSPELSPRPEPGPDHGRPHGRGLLLINALSTAWGVLGAPERKTVWVEIALA
ncbi:MAG TPA: ATP-binding protein [Pseudonocardiaceae bacterium]|nr:ATP-binding protein [Pseudonocardiaceae bacterium]